MAVWTSRGVTQATSRWVLLLAATIAFVALWPLSVPISGLALAAMGVVRLRGRLS